jgi:hypothetical protein
MGPAKSQQPGQAAFLIGGQTGQRVSDSVVAPYDTSKHIIRVSLVVNHQI